jgi:hypothetical protein
VGNFLGRIGGKSRLKVGVKNLWVEETEGRNHLDYFHQEMREMMGEVSLQKNLQHRAGGHLVARGYAVSERAGQARIADEEKTGVVGNNSAHT